MAQPKLETVATNGIHLRVALAGEGPLVLLVHGWPESSALLAPSDPRSCRSWLPRGRAGRARLRRQRQARGHRGLRHKGDVRRHSRPDRRARRAAGDPGRP